MLSVVEIDTDNRLVGAVIFESNDIDAAFEELDARYLAGDAAAHANTWSVIAAAHAGFNRQELPAAADWVTIDHRPLVAIGFNDLPATIRAVWDLTPDVSIHVEAVHRRATAIDPNISIATVYRTVRLFQEAGILAKHDFGDGRARYEETPDEHHDHLIDIQSGKVVEFHNDEIEELQRRIAEKAGYRLVGHRLELYGVPMNGKTDRQK